MTFRPTSDFPIVMDGAMGTELVARGLDIRADIAERWVLDRPEVVTAIHAAYAASGAQLIQTCTFGAVRARLAPHGLADQVRPIICRAIELAKTAAPDLPVVGSLGPSGLVLSPGFQDRALLATLEADFAEAASAMLEGGADAIHLETQLTPAELLAATAGIRRVTETLPLFVSISVMTGSSGLETPHGIPINNMIRVLAQAAPDAIGVNCSLDGERMAAAVALLIDAKLGPVLARPQARTSEKCSTGLSKESPQRYALRAALLFDLGAAGVGGCCGTTPAFIAALSETHRTKPKRTLTSALHEVART